MSTHANKTINYMTQPTSGQMTTVAPPTRSDSAAVAAAGAATLSIDKRC